jgi:hypothetical protein
MQISTQVPKHSFEQIKLNAMFILNQTVPV